FASVQTLGQSRHLDRFPKDYFDYIVVDEFHHTAAATYQSLLQHFSPRFLLGLTATPERTDQSDILSFCDDNLVFNKDLFSGIDAQLLCPFHYYGIADVVDYAEISWRNGKFDPTALVNQLATQARAKHNFVHWQKHKQTRTLAFCVSRKHADFMAAYFLRQGVKAVSVHSESDKQRGEALFELAAGTIEIIFSVDLFNEGVDLPSIDTVLMLRPTESKIVFLQQLGRGLRTCEETGKKKLLVLDFIGNHISFFRKPEAMFKIGVTNNARQEFLAKIAEDTLALPQGCFVNYDLESIDFMKQLTATRVDSQQEVYSALKQSFGRRPTLSEFYRAGGNVSTVRSAVGQWLAFVEQNKDLSPQESSCLAVHQTFFEELEKTNLTKSFKLVLIEALLELDGFQNSPAITLLAEKSFDVLQRRRTLLRDLPENFRDSDHVEDDDTWVSYWRRNPVDAWVSIKKKADTFFNLAGNLFRFNQVIEPETYEDFVRFVTEIVNYRFLQYEARLALSSDAAPEALPTIAPVKNQEVPYFTDLRIACGHFGSSEHDDENLVHVPLPLSYGTLDPARHFIARAKGNSMNGGKSAIVDGDFLLLELITSDSAGSLNGSTVAIEQQDVSGDDQYLLRRVVKSRDGHYDLVANNPDYETIPHNDAMNTIARLRTIVDPTDLYLHNSFMREEIPALFGLEFNTGLWQSGHVCPKGHPDQYLFVTLNKQSHAVDHRYHDYFIDRQTFHWQSQNSTTPKGAKGKRIVNHVKNDGRVFLFVRKNKLERGKGAPFYYCGNVSYQTHEGEKPMSVKWLLDRPLSEELFDLFR
ncbi:MAG: DUF3427 domain-containing protein, partial [Pseudomonadales bacterium]|nr:DUF3427 domain-containing protein [Pseudomonadales bacterium]